MKSFLCWCSLLMSVCSSLAEVRVEGVPEQGLQPEVAVAGDGVVHLVYLRGEPGASEVRYTWRKPGEPWQPSLTLNTAGSMAVAIGSIRGAQLALGKAGTVHVIWNGAGVGQPGRAPLWYARKTAATATFQAPSDLLGETAALDGGASVAADGQGSVFVVWHGNENARALEEKRRFVFSRTSTDDGANFAKAEALNRATPGVCACCSLRALAVEKEGLSVFYRSAATTENRAMTLLTKSGLAWKPRAIETWKISGCPMSSSSLTAHQHQILGAWETAGQIRAGWITGTQNDWTIVATTSAKHPSVAINAQGKLLIAWVEGSGWERGGSAAWQEFDLKLQAIGSKGTSPDVPTWGRVAVYAEPQGDFVVLR